MTQETGTGEITPDGETMALSVVIVSYQGRDLLANCLADVDRLLTRHEVVVVDNASHDGSAKMVEREYPRHRLIANNENVGFARAVNRALPLCSGEFVLLLNPDTSFEAAAIDHLVGFMRNEPSVGAVAPLVEHEAGRRRVLDAGRQWTTWRLFCHTVGLSRLSRRVGFLEGVYLLRGIHDDVRREVEWVGGACLLVRSSVLASVGDLSERWFMYAEDLDLCLRIKQAGYRIVHDCSVRIVHQMGASSQGEADRTRSKVTWARACTDFHHSRLGHEGGADIAWRAVFVLQLLSRALNCRLQAVRRPANQDAWTEEARGFVACARAVVRFEPRVSDLE